MPHDKSPDTPCVIATVKTFDPAQAREVYDFFERIRSESVSTSAAITVEAIKDINEQYGIQYRFVQRKPTTEAFRLATARDLEAFQRPVTLQEVSAMLFALRDEMELTQVPLCEFIVIDSAEGGTSFLAAKGETLPDEFYIIHVPNDNDAQRLREFTDGGCPCKVVARNAFVGGLVTPIKCPNATLTLVTAEDQEVVVDGHTKTLPASFFKVVDEDSTVADDLAAQLLLRNPTWWSKKTLPHHQTGRRKITIDISDISDDAPPAKRPALVKTEPMPANADDQPVVKKRKVSAMNKAIIKTTTEELDIDPEDLNSTITELLDFEAVEDVK